MAELSLTQRITAVGTVALGFFAGGEALAQHHPMRDGTASTKNDDDARKIERAMKFSNLYLNDLLKLKALTDDGRTEAQKAEDARIIAELTAPRVYVIIGGKKQPEHTLIRDDGTLVPEQRFVWNRDTPDPNDVVEIKGYLEFLAYKTWVDGSNGGKKDGKKQRCELTGVGEKFVGKDPIHIYMRSHFNVDLEAEVWMENPENGRKSRPSEFLLTRNYELNTGSDEGENGLTSIGKVVIRIPAIGEEHSVTIDYTGNPVAKMFTCNKWKDLNKDDGFDYPEEFEGMKIRYDKNEALTMIASWFNYSAEKVAVKLISPKGLEEITEIGITKNKTSFGLETETKLLSETYGLGKFRVELYLDGKMMGKTEFEIYDALTEKVADDIMKRKAELQQKK